MTRTVQRLLVVILAIFLSFGILFGGVLTARIYILHYTSDYEEVMGLISPLTRFAVDRYWVLIVIACLFAVVGLLLSTRRATDGFVTAVGIAMPLLTGWFAAFCLSYESFLGPVSMHHPQWFEMSNFLLTFYGFFPITLILILLMLGLSIRDGLRKPE